MSVDADVFDVIVEGSDAAALVAALECARIGLRVGLVDDPDRWMFTPAQFSHHDGVMAKLCEEYKLAYDIVDQPTLTLNVLGIPVNPFNPRVRELAGWRGAWRAYVDRIRPLLAIGNERDFGRLVRSRLGARVLDRVVLPELASSFGIDSAHIDVNEVAPGLVEATSRVGSLTVGALELLAAEPRWRQALSVHGGTHALLDALTKAIQYYAVTSLSVASADRARATVWLSDVATVPERPSWSRAVVRAREAATQAKGIVLSDPENPPVGPIDLAQ